MIGLRSGVGGVWRRAFPVPTPAQRRLLLELARDDALVLEEWSGVVRLRRQGAPVHPRTLAALIHQGWVTEPLPALPLFGAPARDGSITAAGRAALTRRNRW
jgi:hypothetical protein